jgi:hypothetical protein
MIKYNLEEIGPGYGFNLTPSKVEFPRFLFCEEEVNDGSFAVVRKVFYNNKEDAEKRKVFATGKDRWLVFKNSYKIAIEYAKSLKLSLENSVELERRKYLLKED